MPLRDATKTGKKDALVTFSDTLATVTDPATPREVLADTVNTDGEDVMLVPDISACARRIRHPF